MNATPTVSNLEYRSRVKMVNAVAWAGERLGLSLGSLDPESIVRAAQRETGLEDLGDESFLVPLRRIAGTVADNQQLTPLARIIMRQSWILAVRSRLQRQEWLKRNPHVHDQPIQRPIFVLGFPRTGTTLLQNLLALDPRRRGLEFWELTLPVPVNPDRTLDRDHRRRTTSWMLQAAYQIAPEMERVHYIDVDTLEECWPLFGMSFTVMNWDLQSGIRSWGDWLLGEWDMSRPYQEYRTTLKMLLERHPTEQLVLKCPEHLFFIDSLLAAFPDACIVQTHRDPYDTIGSYCSLISMQWRTLYGQIDRPRVGDHMLGRLHDGVRCAMEARDRAADPSRFFDVHFSELLADPQDVVARIAQHFDLSLTDDHAAQIQAYLDNKRADARGQHRYDPSDYGLERSVVHDRYASYIDRFGIEVKR